MRGPEDRWVWVGAYPHGVSTESRRATSVKATSFTESVIREMTRLAAVHDAINLGQGYPDFPAPSSSRKAAALAINDVGRAGGRRHRMMFGRSTPERQRIETHSRRGARGFARSGRAAH